MMPHAIAHIPEFVGHLTGRTRSQVVLAIIAMLMLPLSLMGVVEIKNAAITARMVGSQHLVEASINTIWGYYNAAMAGKITQADAQRAAVAVLDSMFYDKSNYVYGYDYRSQPGKILLKFNRVRPDLVGVDRRDATSVDGVKYVLAGYNVARNGGGFYSYQWDAGGTSPKSRPKVSYASAFEPWGWYIGTGSYIDDILIQFWNNISFVLSLFAALCALGSALIDWLYSRV